MGATEDAVMRRFKLSRAYALDSGPRRSSTTIESPLEAGVEARGESESTI
jgi:hypothetical protein